MSQIASVSRDTGEAIQEISASAEEINAQMEEAPASANALFRMAEELKGLVEKFKTGA